MFNFLKFCKKKTIKWETHFQEKISFDTHSTAISPPLTLLKKKRFFLKQNSTFFLKKLNFRTNLRYLSISVAFCYYLVMKNFRSQNSSEILPGQLANKHEITFALSGWFSYRITDMAVNTKCSQQLGIFIQLLQIWLFKILDKHILCQRNSWQKPVRHQAKISVQHAENAAKQNLRKTLLENTRKKSNDYVICEKVPKKQKINHKNCKTWLNKRRSWFLTMRKRINISTFIMYNDRPFIINIL